jgi:hypothetical protein
MSNQKSMQKPKTKIVSKDRGLGGFLDRNPFSNVISIPQVMSQDPTVKPIHSDIATKNPFHASAPNSERKIKEMPSDLIIKPQIYERLLVIVLPMVYQPYGEICSNICVQVIWQKCKLLFYKERSWCATEVPFIGFDGKYLKNDDF